DATPTPPGGSGTVTVTVYDDGARVAGAPVVFHGADGSPETLSSTDASGEASAPMQAGGMVTVAREVSGERRLETVMGVEPGDSLVFGFAEKRLGPAGVVHVRAPAAVDDASDYVIDAGC